MLLVDVTSECLRLSVEKVQKINEEGPSSACKGSSDEEAENG